MFRSYFLPAAMIGAAFASQSAHAHGVAGNHLFVSTLIIDDPNVADEASLPTFSYLPQPSDTNPAPGLYGLNAEFDKRITENFGFAHQQRIQLAHPAGRKDRDGLVKLSSSR